MGPMTAQDGQTTPQHTHRAWMTPGAMLLMTGCCALVYQVCWLRGLRLVFGASTAANAAAATDAAVSIASAVTCRTGGAASSAANKLHDRVAICSAGEARGLHRGLHGRDSPALRHSHGGTGTGTGTGDALRIYFVVLRPRLGGAVQVARCPI